MTASFLAFLGVSVMVIVTPGPDTAVTVNGTLGGGRRGGVFTALGVSCGQGVWTLAASAGISALLVACEPAFLTVKCLGAAYLLYLGLHAIWSAARQRADPAAAADEPARRSALACYRRGLLSDLGNPKMAVFFHQPAAAIRGQLRRPGAPRAGVLRDDVPLAGLLRHGCRHHG